MRKTPKISEKYPKTFKIGIKTPRFSKEGKKSTSTLAMVAAFFIPWQMFAWFPYCNSFQRLLSNILLWKPSILIARIKFQIFLRPNLCEQYSEWRWNDLSANTILVNRERIQRYHPPIPMIYHTAGCGLIFVESTTWMEYFLCIDYMNSLAMFHINFVISTQACTNLTTVIARVLPYLKAEGQSSWQCRVRLPFQLGVLDPCRGLLSLCVARRRRRRHSRAPRPCAAPRSAVATRVPCALNLLLGKLGSCAVRWPGGRRLLAEEMLRCLTGGSASIVPSFSD